MSVCFKQSKERTGEFVHTHNVGIKKCVADFKQSKERTDECVYVHNASVKKCVADFKAAYSVTMNIFRKILFSF